MTRKALVISVLVLCLGRYLAVADVLIDTTGGWPGTTIGPFGVAPSGDEVFGQTVTAPPSDPELYSFTFYMQLPTTVVFRGEVYAWGGTKASGSDLWEGGPLHTTNTGLEEFQFDTGGLALTGGQQYVLFVTTAKDGGSGAGAVGFTGLDTYGGGNFVYFGGSSTPADWTTTNWDYDAWGADDLAFKARFGQPGEGQVPEPGTMALLLMGLPMGLLWRGKRVEKTASARPIFPRFPVFARG